MDRKDIVRKYKETPRLAGVYRVLHHSSGRTLLGASPDAPARLNRIRVELAMRSHPSKHLQSDWDGDGEDSFTFEVLDLLAAADDLTADISDDLQVLHELWREKLQLGRDSSY